MASKSEARTLESIREYVAKQIEPARRAGAHRVRVITGDVQRSLGLRKRVPNVCQVLDSRKFGEQNHVVIEDKAGPPSGMGTRMVFVYRLEDLVRLTEAQQIKEFFRRR